MRHAASSLPQRNSKFNSTYNRPPNSDRMIVLILTLWGVAVRRIVFASLYSSALPAAAKANQPKDRRPLPEVPEPPDLALPSPGVDEEDESLEPEVTITKRGEDRIEKYRL